MSDEPTNGGPRPRGRTRAEERAEAVTTPSRIELAERIEQLERELAETKAKSEEHLYHWQRSAADFSNYKRRTEDERAQLSQFSNAVLINKLLGVLDDFDRALESVPAEAHDAWIEGVKLVERKLRSVLESEGVTAIALHLQLLEVQAVLRQAVPQRRLLPLHPLAYVRRLAVDDRRHRRAVHPHVDRHLAQMLGPQAHRCL